MPIIERTLTYPNRIYTVPDSCYSSLINIVNVLWGRGGGRKQECNVGEKFDLHQLDFVRNQSSGGSLLISYFTVQ